MNKAKQKTVPVALQEEAILKLEFNYIEKTAFQANEDRARVSNYYLSAGGSLIAILLGVQFKESGQLSTTVLYGFSLLFGVLAVTGYLTLLQLVRLRKAWHDSVSAMLRIKEYYWQHFANTNLPDAFLWKSNSQPPAYKTGSISYLLALQVAMMTGVMLGVCYFCLARANDHSAWWSSAVLGLLCLAALMVWYKHLLEKKQEHLPMSMFNK